MSDGGGGAVFGSGAAGCKTRSMSAQDHVGFGSVNGAVEGETVSFGGGGGIRGSGGCERSPD